MTELLVRKYVKDYEDVSEQSVRTAYGVLSSIIGIIGNVILFITKITIGLIMNSVSVIADAFNNLSDAVSSIIGYVGVKMADKPADKEHPFGHGRYEYIAALIVSFIIIEVGLSMLKSSFSKIFNPTELNVTYIHIIILVLSILIKFWLVLFNTKLGKRINSNVMKATAADSISDILITSVMILSIVISKYTNLMIDGYMGLIVSIFVMISGVKIAKDTLLPLIGEAIDRDLYHKVKDMIESYEGIVGTHDLIIHSYGPTKHMATIHVEVPNDVDIEHIHETIDKIEKDVQEELGIGLVIHMDPIEVNDENVVEIRTQITEIIQSIEPLASMHDFRLVNGEENINLIFEMVLPYTYSTKDEEEMLTKIKDEVKKLDIRYTCVIEVENSFVAEI